MQVWSSLSSSSLSLSSPLSSLSFVVDVVVDVVYFSAFGFFVMLRETKSLIIIIAAKTKKIRKPLFKHGLALKR